MLFFVRPTTPSKLKIISVTKMALPTLCTLLCLLCITVIEEGPQMPADTARQNDQTRLRRKNFLFLSLSVQNSIASVALHTPPW